MLCAPETAREHPEIILEEIRRMKIGNVNLMEVCGTHTMEIAKSGLRSVLPENVHLLSGPGCPVCVTPPEVIDAILQLAERPDVIITTYGDMIRVPGTVRRKTLASGKAAGAQAEVVYSPMDAIEIARMKPEKHIVFLGVGFETTAPGTAVAVKEAKRLGLKNFSVLSMLKMVEPALRTLIADPEFNVQGFLCPGHVATIIGEDGFRFLPEEFGIPAVISGFEPEDILYSVYLLLKQIEAGEPKLENQYTRAVMPEGNPLAMRIMDEVLIPGTDLWRGLGEIENSGLLIRDEFAEYDTRARFGLHFEPKEDKTGCRCGDVIQGKLDAVKCPLFGKACTPDDPWGPCMVSSEGTCAAAFKYRGI